MPNDDETTIHLEPVTQIVDEGTFFVGIPVDEGLHPIEQVLVGVSARCARAVFLSPIVDPETREYGVGIYVFDHHGRTMLSNVTKDAQMYGDLALYMN